MSLISTNRFYFLHCCEADCLLEPYLQFIKQSQADESTLIDTRNSNGITNFPTYVNPLLVSKSDTSVSKSDTSVTPSSRSNQKQATHFNVDNLRVKQLKTETVVDCRWKLALQNYLKTLK
jgi:hypothetical protein